MQRRWASVLAVLALALLAEAAATAPDASVDDALSSEAFPGGLEGFISVKEGARCGSQRELLAKATDAPACARLSAKLGVQAFSLGQSHGAYPGACYAERVEVHPRIMREWEDHPDKPNCPDASGWVADKDFVFFALELQDLTVGVTDEDMMSAVDSTLDASERGPPHQGFLEAFHAEQAKAKKANEQAKAKEANHLPAPVVVEQPLPAAALAATPPAKAVGQAASELHEEDVEHVAAKLAQVSPAPLRDAGDPAPLEHGSDKLAASLGVPSVLGSSEADVATSALGGGAAEMKAASKKGAAAPPAAEKEDTTVWDRAGAMTGQLAGPPTESVSRAASPHLEILSPPAGETEVEAQQSQLARGQVEFAGHRMLRQALG